MTQCDSRRLHHSLQSWIRRTGGNATLYINGQSVGAVKVAQTRFAFFSADETAGVGVDMETPVSEDYDWTSSKFTGKIEKVTINLKK